MIEAVPGFCLYGVISLMIVYAHIVWKEEVWNAS